MNPSKSILVSFPSLKMITALSASPAVKKPDFLKLAIYTSDETRFIPFDQILFCHSKNNYTMVHTRSGKPMLCCKTLKEIESKLPAELFLRIHHSYLVNMKDITALKKQSGVLEINNEYLIPYSRAMNKYLHELLCC